MKCEFKMKIFVFISVDSYHALATGIPSAYIYKKEKKKIINFEFFCELTFLNSFMFVVTIGVPKKVTDLIIV